MPRAVVVFGPMRIVSFVRKAMPAFVTLALMPPVWTDCGSNTCQFVVSTLPCVNRDIHAVSGGTRSRVRYRLASPSSGSSSRSRLRIVTFGQTISTTSENRRSLRSLTLLRILQAASIPITVVLPLPVAILQEYRGKPVKPSAFLSALGSSRGMSMPSRKSARASVRKMIVTAASICAKNNRFSRPSRRHHCSNSKVVRVTPG